MPSFATALSGLESNNTALNTIANNIANMNTVGYKDQTDQFSTLFYQQLNGGVNGGVQVGVGTQVVTTETDFSSGAPTSTGQSTDMALQGNGFFVVNDNGQQELTRAGDFVQNQSGALQTTDGASVMGYPAANGSINLGSGVQPIVLPLGQTMAASPTTTMNIQANLDASAGVGATVPAPITLYDSLGGAQQATVTFTKTGTNTWDYNIALPAGAATGSTGTTGTLTFDGNGNLTSPTGTVGGISFTGLSDGASDMNFSWNLSGTSGAITQTASASNVASAIPDGYPSGSYQGFSVDGNGIVEASFSNGQKEVVGQVAVATVSNEQGLQATSNTAYLATLASGSAVIGTAGSAGGGTTIEGASLESSNVDVSTEFSALIIAQRAFEANSKSVTTFDQATQEAINMIH